MFGSLGFLTGATCSIASCTWRMLPITCPKTIRFYHTCFFFLQRLRLLDPHENITLQGRSIATMAPEMSAKMQKMLPLNEWPLHLRVQLPFFPCKNPLPFIYSKCSLPVRFTNDMSPCSYWPLRIVSRDVSAAGLMTSFKFPF